jgi:vacuolar-type H+-ATPase subunit C/Vma6
MIDNVVLIVTGTLHERDVNELLEKCHPLGMFDRYSCGSSLVSLKWEIYQNTDSSFF